MGYDLNHFRLYCNLVITEMEKRGYKVSDKTKAKLCQYLKGRISVSNVFGGQLSVLINNEYEPLFDNWHTDRYLKQCLYNLEEKYDRGGITQEEWDNIYNKYELKW